MALAEVWLDTLKLLPLVAAGLACGWLLTTRRAPAGREGRTTALMLMRIDEGPSSVSSGTASVWSGQIGGRASSRRAGPAWQQRLLGRAGLGRAAISWALLLVVLAGVAALAVVVRKSGREAPSSAVVSPATGPAVAPAVATNDGGLKFGALAARSLPEQGDGSEPAEVAWLFGALVSGGRSADAWALLTPEAQRATSVDNFGALLGSVHLLRSSDDAPWRVPGSNTFLFSVSGPEDAASLKGELRVGLEMVGGQWRVSRFKLRER